MSKAITRIAEGYPSTPERPRSGSVAPRRSRSTVILLIDPRPLTRECLSHLLQASARDFRIIPIADPAEVSANEALSEPADLIVFSIGGAAVTDGSVSETICFLRRALPYAPIVVLSDREGAEHVVEAIRRGVRGYIPTSLPLSTVIETLRFVRAGGTFVPASAIMPLGQREQEAEEGKPSGGVGPVSLDRFTARELEVLALLRQGKPNKIIAYELDMQEATVKVHVRHIKHKLGATNRIQAALRCQQVFKSQNGSAGAGNHSLQGEPVQRPGETLRSSEPSG